MPALPDGTSGANGDGFEMSPIVFRLAYLVITADV